MMPVIRALCEPAAMRVRGRAPPCHAITSVAHHDQGGVFPSLVCRPCMMARRTSSERAQTRLPRAILEIVILPGSSLARSRCDKSATATPSCTCCCGSLEPQCASSRSAARGAGGAGCAGGAGAGGPRDCVHLRARCWQKFARKWLREVHGAKNFRARARPGVASLIPRSTSSC